ncbi:hypothetical protein R5W24_006171 [Gemmata sp. JC717]|uniref:HEAT repeat domain-containing protein n=1 Tax=Gemmata algarum TaxID=2975278 RepID=UPI0021BA596E|nr:hypothetical protein [Gemmata algarum]MDY3556989.1 hypothetical protein [Gemmata algarum]
MNDYTPPVSGLLKLGDPGTLQTASDYPALGFDTSHVPQLLRLLTDRELLASGGDTPEVYAQVHAWRALGQLRAAEAVEPLLDLIDAQGGDDWDDWVATEVPFVLGQIGPAAVPQLVARLSQHGRQEDALCSLSSALTEVAKRYPEARAEVVGCLMTVLDAAAENSAAFNGFVIADLLDLSATEAWPAIERAFATNNVDETIAGDAALVKYELGLGPEPSRPRRLSARPTSRSGMNAKQRFNERQRKKKAEKKKNKKKRNG